MGKKRRKEKFQFGIDFQESILQYILLGEKGYKAIELIDDNYFTLVHHGVIAYSIKKYYKAKKKIPKQPFFREFLRGLYQKEVSLLRDLLPDDKDTIDQLITKLYSETYFDEEMILEKVTNFAKFVKFKEALEDIDVDNYSSYEHSIKKFNDINLVGADLVEDYGTFIVAGMPERAHKRDIYTQGYATPYWQMNRLLNSGGTNRGNVIVVMGQEKRFKTGFLINLAKNYLKRRKKVVYFDLENGEHAIQIRAEQSFINKSRKEILSEDYDDKLLKLMRKYKRIGAELVVKRFNALQTTTDDFQKFLDKLYKDKGFKADVCIIDFALLMACISGKKDDTERISEAFLDTKNFAEHNGFEATYTAAHVTRQGIKRLGTKFEATDIAKCIDITRHIDALWGLQENDEEKNNGILRVEVIEQRDGPLGKGLFWVDVQNQNLKEFTRGELKEYLSQVGDEDATFDEKPNKLKRKKGTGDL